MKFSAQINQLLVWVLCVSVSKLCVEFQVACKKIEETKEHHRNIGGVNIGTSSSLNNRNRVFFWGGERHRSQREVCFVCVRVVMCFECVCRVFCDVRGNSFEIR